MPGKARATARALGTKVLEPCQGFRLLEDCLDKGVQGCIPLCYSKDRVARLRLESIRKEGVSPAQLVSRDHGLFQRVRLCKRLDPGDFLCHII